MLLSTLAFVGVMLSAPTDAHSKKIRATSLMDVRAQFVESSGINITSRVDTRYAHNVVSCNLVHSNMSISIQGAVEQPVAVSCNVRTQDGDNEYWQACSSQETLLMPETKKLFKNVFLPVEDFINLEKQPAFVIDVSYL